jgi:F-type H+-transporting ATPase subunit b
MRIKRLVAVGVLAGGLLLAVAQPASAEDPGKKSGKELVACVKSAVADNKSTIDKGNYDPFTNALDDCHAAKSLLTPALPELIWGVIAFAIVAFVLMKFGFPAIKTALKTREDRIRGDLERAEEAKVEAEQLAERHRAELDGARAEAGRIIEAARSDAEAVGRERIAAAEAEAAQIRRRAGDDIRLATERAQTDLRRRVTELSIELAERVVERNLDRDTQTALIDSYIARVGGNGAGSN